MEALERIFCFLKCEDWHQSRMFTDVSWRCAGNVSVWGHVSYIWWHTQQHTVTLGWQSECINKSWFFWQNSSASGQIFPQISKAENNLCHFYHYRSRSFTSLFPYLSPLSGVPLQPFVLGAAPQDAGLLGFGFVVLSAHAVGHHHRLGPGIGAAAKHAPLPQSTTTGLGALQVDKGGGQRSRCGAKIKK